MKFTFGLILGFGLGAVVGLLLAPQSGEATRAQLGESVALKTGNGSFTDELRTRVAVISDDLRSRAGEAMVQGRELYNRTKDELSDRYSQARSGNL